MYQIGDVIVYGGEGVCRVDAIGVPDIPSISKERLYYTLSPFYRDGIIFSPVDTTVFMRPVITYEEVQHLIMQIPEIRTNMLCENHRSIRMLSDHYAALLQTHDCAALLQLIKTVYKKRQVVTENGKKLGTTDERYLKRAEEMLYSEFAVALGIPKDDVKSYIEDTVKKLESAGRKQALISEESDQSWI